MLAEVASDFADSRLPTLDFSMWMKKDQMLSQTYFEKKMITQKVIEKETAMGANQKYRIMSNELICRLYNIDEEREGKE